MTYFLLIFDPDSKSAAAVESFAGESEALARLFEAESEHAHDDLEVVLLVAEDAEDLLRTHSRFFKSLDQLLEPA